MAVKKTVISNFHNEEYLLPWWLEHHKKIFNHGILINYQSTDRSVEIIKKICPTWEVIDSRNSDYNIVEVDQEIMEIERRVWGAKIALTMGEFFIDKGIDNIIAPHKMMCLIPEVIMVDDDPDEIPTYDKPLVEQKTFGVSTGSHRIFHTCEDGNYEVGRHRSRHTPYNCDLKVSMDSYIKWYKYSPWTKEFIDRKLQFQNRVRKVDLDHGMGDHYTWDQNRMEQEIIKLFLFGCKNYL
jgi:hypothetical protein